MLNILNLDVFFIKSKADLSENVYSYIEGSFLKKIDVHGIKLSYIFEIPSISIERLIISIAKLGFRSKNPEQKYLVFRKLGILSRKPVPRR